MNLLIAGGGFTVRRTRASHWSRLQLQKRYLQSPNTRLVSYSCTRRRSLQHSHFSVRHQYHASIVGFFSVSSCLNKTIMIIYIRATCISWTKKTQNIMNKRSQHFFFCLFFVFFCFPCLKWFRALENMLAFQIQSPYPSNSSSNKTKLYSENEYWLSSSIPDLLLCLYS